MRRVGRRPARGAARLGGPAVALVAALVLRPVVACPLPSDAGPVLSDGDVQATWRLADVPVIMVGTHFALQVRACPVTAELVRVDATMPAHRHGMNYRPSIAATGPGAWHVEGLMFHMRGSWELVLELRQGGRMHRLRQAVELP